MEQKTAVNQEIAIVKCVRDLGVPANIAGYFYIIDAVKIAVREKLSVLNMPQNIYAPIAKMYDTTPQKVSQAIKRAIAIGWDRADLSTLQSLFGNAAFHAANYPSNAEWIAVISEVVRLRMMQEDTTPAVQVMEKGTADAVARKLHDFGVPSHIKGYLYLHEAICRCIEKKELLSALYKELYPHIARTFDTTPSRVERAIRHAVEVAWDRGPVDTLQAHFGCTINNTKGKPTNAEFIAIIADDIRRTMKK